MAQQDRERGERIAEMRKAAGYTSADKLASALDVNYRSVQNWEAGKGISEENVKPLAELLGVTREFILYGGPETPDLMGAVNGSNDLQRQLDRIEEMLTEVLALMRPESEVVVSPTGVGRPTPLHQRRTPQGSTAPRKKRAGS